jgi:uncharacterized membrane protein
LLYLAQLAPTLAGWLSLLRIPLGLAYVLFIPGYLLQAFLFPRLDDLDGIERMGLSLGLSVALVPLLALLLDRLPWGLRFWPIAIGQCLLILLLLLAALAHRWVLIRRLTLPAAEVYAPNLRPHPAEWWHALEPLDRRLYLLAAAACSLPPSLPPGYFSSRPAEFMTEFYMLGKDGLLRTIPVTLAWLMRSPSPWASPTRGVLHKNTAWKSGRSTPSATAASLPGRPILHPTGRRDP